MGIGMGIGIDIGIGIGIGALALELAAFAFQHLRIGVGFYVDIERCVVGNPCTLPFQVGEALQSFVSDLGDGRTEAPAPVDADSRRNPSASLQLEQRLSSAPVIAPRPRSINSKSKSKSKSKAIADRTTTDNNNNNNNSNNISKSTLPPQKVAKPAVSVPPAALAERKVVAVPDEADSDAIRNFLPRFERVYRSAARSRKMNDLAVMIERVRFFRFV